MKEFCFDTSGLSNPLETMPEDIHQRLWGEVANTILSGSIAITQEIFDEMSLFDGSFGKHIRANKSNLVLEVGQDKWDWQTYTNHVVRMQNDHRAFISEFNGDRKSTIGLNDLSIVALGKTLQLPVVSMESSAAQSLTKMRIPDLCKAEDIEHLRFNDFLRKKSIVIT